MTESLKELKEKYSLAHVSNILSVKECHKAIDEAYELGTRQLGELDEEAVAQWLLDEHSGRAIDLGKEFCARFGRKRAELSKEDICGIALEVGFMISTQYGQEEPKLMPVSDYRTLVEFAKRLTVKKVDVGEIEKLLHDKECRWMVEWGHEELAQAIMEYLEGR